MKKVQIDLENILEWSEPVRVNTKLGPRLLSKAEPDSDFWELWKGHKEELKKAGISLSKSGEEWEACWWQEAD